MIEYGTAMLEEARASGTAVTAFNVYTLESIKAVCEAAVTAGRPVIIAAGASSFKGTSRELLAAAALAAAKVSEVRVGVHLDHCRSVDEIEACIGLGYSSVMIDGSHLPFAENVALTRQVVQYAHARGVWVEGELGGIAGSEDASSGASAVQLTSPDEAEEFVELTGVDLLAPAVGTVHGFTPEPLVVDLPRLREVAARTAIPLALHGGSGLTDAQLRDAVSGGIAKVNINAELRRAHLRGLDRARPIIGDDISALQQATVEAMTEIALERVRLLAGT